MTARHRLALTDWLACAVGGAREPAVVAARAAGDGLLERVATAGAAGHVLDFDDTYAPGLAHLSAVTAPAALVLGAELGAAVGAALAAYAAGFEAMGALARTCHPALYDGGWHPTAVCGSAGAAVVAARLHGLDAGRERRAIALALLRAGGLRAAFGSDGKALQVGMAAAAGVHAARLAAAGAAVDAGAIAGAGAGFAEAFGVATSAATLDAMIEAADSAATEGDAAAENWIKAYPCCLQTHAAIDAALALGAHPSPASEITVAVHPLSRQAAALDEVCDGLTGCRRSSRSPISRRTRSCAARPTCTPSRTSTTRWPRSRGVCASGRTPRSAPRRRSSSSTAARRHASRRRADRRPTRSTRQRSRRRSARSPARCSTAPSRTQAGRRRC
jgi:2-methylcitrate dehydratase PrpD